MVIVTLVGELQAREGMEFVYMGPLTECKECRLKAVCFNLDPGSTYRITAVRDVHHECRVHEEGVHVVEVEKIPMRCTVPSKYAIEGSVITFTNSRCDDVGCEHYRLCNPPGPVKNTKRRVLSVHGDVSCPRGQSLKEVELE